MQDSYKVGGGTWDSSGTGDAWLCRWVNLEPLFLPSLKDGSYKAQGYKDSGREEAEEGLRAILSNL